MTAPAPTMSTLAELASSPGTAVAVADTVGSSGMDAVVLSRVDAVTIEIAANGAVRRIPDTTAVTDIADPDRRLTLLTEALSTLDRARRDLAARQLQQRDRHARTLGQIRRMAIAHYQDGRYCLAGLNEFLRTFDLPEHDGRI